MKKFGDRKDGKLLRGVDSFHLIMNNIYPNRTKNESCVLEPLVDYE